MATEEFHFKRFIVRQDRCAMKVSTDALVFGAWVELEEAQRVLDIGTGTGVLALMVAQRAPDAEVHAVELDERAAEQAVENVLASPFSDRISIHHMDVRRMRTAVAFDLVLCNPPYYEGYSSPADERVGLAKHGGGLPFSDLVAAVDRLLAPNGRAAFIIPTLREDELQRCTASAGLAMERRCLLRYVAHRPAKRVLLTFGRSSRPCRMEELVVEEFGDAGYTPAVRALLADLKAGL